ncbi:hypothetical protein A0H81_09000, partial [Grifola frondosa]
MRHCVKSYCRDLKAVLVVDSLAATSTAYCELCPCGRSFSSPGAFSNHWRVCAKNKKRTASALAKLQDIWRAAKRRRQEATGTNSPATAPSTSATTTAPASIATCSHGPITQKESRRENRCLPKRYQDILPEPVATPSISQPVSANIPSTQPSSSAIHSAHLGPSRIYFGHPETHLDCFVNIASHPNMPRNIQSSGITESEDLIANPYDPYPNQSSFLLGEWYWNDGVKKSQSSFMNMTKIIPIRTSSLKTLRKPTGNVWIRIWQVARPQLMAADSGENIRTVPSQDASSGPVDFLAGNLCHRRLVSIIRDKISNPEHHRHFTYEPYEVLWQPGEASDPIRVHGELYSSQAFIDAHRDLQDAPGEPDCDLPKVIVGLMFASDGTHLTECGNSKLWPLYLAFGNESKYRRSKPSCEAYEHVAYFETLPASFKDFAKMYTGGKGPNQPFLTHCHREMLHAQWSILLDDEFLEAYRHGIVIDCCDGVRRRFYPRIFTYSADYPEKIIIASIRNLGRCPCPRCLIPLDRVHNLGMARDLAQRTTLSRVDDVNHRNQVASARSIIYNMNYAVNSAAVERLLAKESLSSNANEMLEIVAKRPQTQAQLLLKMHAEPRLSTSTPIRSTR